MDFHKEPNESDSNSDRPSLSLSKGRVTTHSVLFRNESQAHGDDINIKVLLPWLRCAVAVGYPVLLYWR